MTYISRMRLISLLALIGVFFTLTLRTGHNWGDDFAMFIHHAENIVNGKPYGATGYVFNPYHPGFGPDAYPPVFPLLLAPVYKVFGLNLAVMKFEGVLFFLGALACFYGVFRKSLTEPWTLGLVALIGFHPEVWDFKDNILADFYFLFFLSASLWVIQTMPTVETSTAKRWARTVLLGLLFYGACGTKTIGVMLMASLILSDLGRLRKIDSRHGIAVLIGGGLLAVQYFILGGDSRMKQDALTTLLSIRQNIVWYTEEFCALWHNGYFKVISVGLFAVVNLFAIRGYVSSVKKGITAMEIFPWLYLITIILYPWCGQFRLIMPLFPIYGYYLFLGMKETHLPSAYRWVYPLTFAAILCTYIARYTTISWGPISNGATSVEATQLYDYVRGHTEQNDLVICRKPRAFALFTDRRAAVFSEPAPDRPLWRFVQESSTSYLLEAESDPTYYKTFIHEHAAQTALVFSNAEFHLWKIKRYNP